jgi:hypothetical protein
MPFFQGKMLIFFFDFNGCLLFSVGKERGEIRKRPRSGLGFSRRSLSALLGVCETRRTRTIELIPI